MTCLIAHTAREKIKCKTACASRAELFCLQRSVSKDAIAFTVNVSIKRDQGVRCEGIPQGMLRRVDGSLLTVGCLETHCADDNRLTKLISAFWGYPAADSDILPSITT